jgi:hypothetical protein
METKLTPEEITQLQDEIENSLRMFEYKGGIYYISKSSFADKIIGDDGDVLPEFEYLDESIAFYCNDEDFDLPEEEFRKMLLEATEWE